jgi:hypothetical protein
MTALKALRDGGIDAIDGVYATVPYISGGYGWPQERKLAELPSLYENEGYFLNTAMMDLLVAIYDPTGDNAENPLCWPYFATVEDLRGLPPHVIAVNELDPLRDEGVAYYRTLLAAGVRVTGRVNLGITHGADLIFRRAIPDVYRSAIADTSPTSSVSRRPCRSSLSWSCSLRPMRRWRVRAGKRQRPAAECSAPSPDSRTGGCSPSSSNIPFCRGSLHVISARRQGIRGCRRAPGCAEVFLGR